GSGVSVLLGNGDGSFQDPVYYATGSYPSSVVVGDFNGDGIPDLAVANYGSSHVSVLLGNGDGSFQAARNFYFDGSLHPSSLAVADFNGDGSLDLATILVPEVGDGNYLGVLLGNGDGSFRFGFAYNFDGGATSLAVGDFDHDGSPDLAIAGGDVSILINDRNWGGLAPRPPCSHGGPRSASPTAHPAPSQPPAPPPRPPLPPRPPNP